MIQCTETHPFQVKDKGWVDACNLKPGDVVYTKNWGTATVQSVNLLEFDEPVEVFNFEVEDCHTYFVSELNVLVHNTCPNPNGKKGGPAHQSTIDKEAQKLKAAGYSDISFENRIDITGGYKSKRFTDLMGTKGNKEIHVQVGKATKAGIPVARERRALEDLLKAGIDAIFVPYNG